MTLVIVVIEDDPLFKRRVERIINEQMSAMYDCTFLTRVKRVHTLFGEIELEDVFACEAQRLIGGGSAGEVPPEEREWSWHARYGRVGISWLRLLLFRRIELDVEIFDVTTMTRSRGWDIAIRPHLEALMRIAPSKLPIIIKTFSLRYGTLTCHPHDLLGTFVTNYKVDAYALHNVFTTHIYFDKGYICYNDQIVLNHTDGEITITQNAQEGVMQCRCTVDMPFLPESQQRCTISGSYRDGKFACDLVQSDHAISGTFALGTHLTGDLMVPCAYIADIFYKGAAAHTKGSCTLSVFADLADIQKTCKIKGMIKDASIGSVILPHCSFEHQGLWDKSSGSGRIAQADNDVVHLSWNWDTAQSGYACTVHMLSTIPLFAEWALLKQDAVLSGIVTRTHMHATYQAHIASTQKKQEKHLVKGVVQISLPSDNLSVQGSCDAYNYSCTGALSSLYNKTLILKDKMKDKNHDMVKSLLEVRSDQSGAFSGSIDYTLVPLVLSLGFPIERETLSGEGIVTFSGTLQRDESDGFLVVRGVFGMRDGNVRLPYTYNIIKDFDVQAEFTPGLKSVRAHDCHLEFHKGSLSCSNLDFRFDEDGELRFMYASLLVKDYFLSWNKDFFASISGDMHIQCALDQLCKVTAHGIVDNAHLQGNLLSPDTHSDIAGQLMAFCARYPRWGNMQLDMKLETRTPVQVKTPFLEAAVRSAVTVKGSLEQPHVVGDFEFLSGTLLFPYQPLYVTQAKITINPHQLDDPYIDLHARGTIRKYTISMSVTGTATDPVIQFDASPTLREEEIISLLLGGSEDGSIYLVLPSTIKQNIEELMFGSASSTSSVQKYLKNLFKPLQYIRIVPGFSDQSGRGGVRGTLEIDVNDRLKGIIQQNFSLSEDANIEVEYALSDDTLVRGMRDARGDLGAEIETRWKF